MAVKVENYHLHRPDGSHIKIATRVIFDDGEIISFVEKMSKREAIKNAQYQKSLRRELTPSEWKEIAEAPAEEQYDDEYFQK